MINITSPDQCRAITLAPHFPVNVVAASHHRRSDCMERLLDRQFRPLREKRLSATLHPLYDFISVPLGVVENYIKSDLEVTKKPTMLSQGWTIS